ncbi:putative uncharacterized protein [Lacticaseibacillus paracasei NRIC 1981]|uniref:hypothetical protein n=1 Tax=Lacticaseibacillus paracasei TaxID=1597 RepID=UPI0005E651F5|nr:hypothetical protein [Lacticaseibacillus paracasei]GAN41569.1 putative uncharacterized protein [Lacticaseibacillus paracasei NRIC 1981]
MKLYLVTCEAGDADQWEGGTAEVDAVFATTDKATIDDYLSTRIHGYDNVVTMELDKEYHEGTKSSKCLASWWEEGPCYDDPMDI